MKEASWKMQIQVDVQITKETSEEHTATRTNWQSTGGTGPIGGTAGD